MFRQIIILGGLIGLIIGSMYDSVAQDQYPGRFFTTPEQRNAIDSIRYAIEPEIQRLPLLEPQNMESEAKATAKGGPVNFKGYVKNQKGETVYWVNSKNSMESGFNEDEFKLKHVKSDPEILKLFIHDDKPIELEVGESYVPKYFKGELGSAGHKRVP